MPKSILDSTKKALMVGPDYDVFDDAILMHINTALSTLNQLGIGPVEGYFVEDAEETWEDFMGDDPRLSSARSYVYLKVRSLFDPPSGVLLQAMTETMKEMEVRLEMARNPPAGDPPVVQSVTIDV